jgi:hypothetical protein
MSVAEHRSVIVKNAGHLAVRRVEGDVVEAEVAITAVRPLRGSTLNAAPSMPAAASPTAMSLSVGSPVPMRVFTLACRQPSTAGFGQYKSRGNIHLLRALTPWETNNADDHWAAPRFTG